MSQPTWQCFYCAHVYDPAIGDPEAGIAPGTAWEDLPGDYICPGCGADKVDFFLVEPP